ncbi:MAG: hypothetical protein VKP57_10235 [Candidatus Sericytochromatia bacterium]|nr:hypothetical protein [Candidatus Sericytochromatia bacterium]
MIADTTGPIRRIPAATAQRVLARVARLEARCLEARLEVANLREALAQAERGQDDLRCRLAEREEHLERTVLLQAFRSQEPRRALWPFSLAAR